MSVSVQLTYYMQQHFPNPAAYTVTFGRRKKPLTYSDILIKHFNDDGGRVDRNFIDVSPQNQVLENQHLIPGRTPCLPDHTRVSNKMCKDNTTKGICDQNKVMPWELYNIEQSLFCYDRQNYFNVIGWERANLSPILNLHWSASWRAPSSQISSIINKCRRNRMKVEDLHHWW